MEKDKDIGTFKRPVDEGRIRQIEQEKEQQRKDIGEKKQQKEEK